MVYTLTRTHHAPSEATAAEALHPGSGDGRGEDEALQYLSQQKSEVRFQTFQLQRRMYPKSKEESIKMFIICGTEALQNYHTACKDTHEDSTTFDSPFK